MPTEEQKARVRKSISKPISSIIDSSELFNTILRRKMLVERMKVDRLVKTGKLKSNRVNKEMFNRSLEQALKIFERNEEAQFKQFEKSRRRDSF